jgi:hypothetical protein
VHVGAAVDRVRAAGHLLRGGVLRRAREVAGARQPRVVGEVREPEVEQPRAPGGVDQHVRRLDVAVHHAVLVRVRERLGDVEREPGHDLDVRRAPRAQRAPRAPHAIGLGRVVDRGDAAGAPRALQVVGAQLGRREARPAQGVEHCPERRAGHEVHRVVRHAPHLADVADRDDVRVVQPPRRVDLASEALARALVPRELRIGELQGDRAAGRILACREDHRHAAGAQALEDRVPGDVRRTVRARGAGRRVRRRDHPDRREAREPAADRVDQLGMVRAHRAHGGVRVRAVFRAALLEAARDQLFEQVLVALRAAHAELRAAAPSVAWESFIGSRVLSLS